MGKIIRNSLELEIIYCTTASCHPMKDSNNFLFYEIIHFFAAEQMVFADSIPRSQEIEKFNILRSFGQF